MSTIWAVSARSYGAPLTVNRHFTATTSACRRCATNGCVLVGSMFSKRSGIPSGMLKPTRASTLAGGALGFCIGIAVAAVGAGVLSEGTLPQVIEVRAEGGAELHGASLPSAVDIGQAALLTSSGDPRLCRGGSSGLTFPAVCGAVGGLENTGKALRAALFAGSFAKHLNALLPAKCPSEATPMGRR